MVNKLGIQGAKQILIECLEKDMKSFERDGDQQSYLYNSFRIKVIKGEYAQITDDEFKALQAEHNALVGREDWRKSTNDKPF